MLKAVLELFRNNQDDKPQQHTVKLATAALLSEIIRADRQADPRELQAYKTLLNEQFSLSDDELSTLMEEGQSSAEEAVDLVQFTQVINQKYNNNEKQDILTDLWKVAYADENIAPIEEHIIRRIADLLYIPHSQFIKSKLSVTENHAE
ncbi:TerB family tellurite resistance protein [Alteromonas confluentis]|uniref:Co-chaperone DjlA N-terminal domain-containing protein n=1 Tax=Alteromonas confluentis TaxID=1656094 RepID=A0A1E7Z7K2_9ALTE|nr:TerB family tellurite resistance protein [Alteromonas confluentis]OFC69442.1 hypothetical protein BFC18_18740 [Alteromonas confluentis]